jgi:hypothetical protein
MNTVNITVPQAVEVPLEPIVEAVRQALYSVSAPIDDVMENITSGGSLAKAVNTVIEDYLMGSTELDDAVTSVIDSNYTILDNDDVGNIVTSIIEDDYSFLTEDDVTALIETALSDRGWDNIDPSEFPTVADHDALTVRISGLEARVEQLEYTLRKMAEALTAVTQQ